MNLEKAGFFTKAVHAGEKPCPLTGSHATPIYQTSTFVLKRNVEQPPTTEWRTAYIYTRAGNPTHTVLEEKMAILEGGEAALATASGMAAISTVIFTLLKEGDQIISSDTLYGSTYTLFKEIMPKLGVKTVFVDATNPANMKNALTNKTKMIFIETPANPTMDIVDIRAVSEIANESDAKVVVDNTFMTPYYQRPMELGADAVVYSATKYLSGHGDTLGGIVVGSRNFVMEVRRTLALTGGVTNPFNAWLIVRGLKTLALRMDKHSENAMAVAKFLSEHSKVKKVLYPGLPSHPQHELAKKQMRDFGGILAFEIKGGMKEAYTMMEKVKLCRCAVSLGDTATLIEHPATMTHRMIPQEERLQLGITDGLIRLSIGIEDSNDIIVDLDQALK
ncbi:MAG: putative aspartate aminotransferase 2 [Candidatus Bathyarchaeota archaeon BA2]|nr:MAG: putative aspartate aminotransferase 2 [Candidatus Bathyarchaeota archaeon BA2]